jgi:hypothetical protein
MVYLRTKPSYFPVLCFKRVPPLLRWEYSASERPFEAPWSLPGSRECTFDKVDHGPHEEKYHIIIARMLLSQAEANFL